MINSVDKTDYLVSILDKLSIDSLKKEKKTIVWSD